MQISRLSSAWLNRTCWEWDPEIRTLGCHPTCFFSKKSKPVPSCWGRSGFLPVAGNAEDQVCLSMVLQKFIPAPRKNLLEHTRMTWLHFWVWRKEFNLKQNIEVPSSVYTFSWAVSCLFTSLWVLFHAPDDAFVYLGQLVFNWFSNKGISCSFTLIKNHSMISSGLDKYWWAEVSWG